jgi:hypothetical protein
MDDYFSSNLNHELYSTDPSLEPFLFDCSHTEGDNHGPQAESSEDCEYMRAYSPKNAAIAIFLIYFGFYKVAQDVLDANGLENPFIDYDREPSYTPNYPAQVNSLSRTQSRMQFYYSRWTLSYLFSNKAMWPLPETVR